MNKQYHEILKALAVGNQMLSGYLMRAIDVENGIATPFDLETSEALGQYLVAVGLDLSAHAAGQAARRALEASSEPR